ncbi:bifunctional transcriptional activator/DNA repair enzyme AdaA [Cohnella hongkongensis]|uniref:Bifunctional transcriptional activator/DNA repair enzyme AdaA n=1 Tax=Cohnella hongkongensis TaxID=178337 RepID=A0ABV9F589_9BACL
MLNPGIALTDDVWRVIVGNDGSLNGKLYYAVKTTGIFCRPSCKSRPPRRENIRLFRTAEQALQAGFRPCKRCKPTGERLPDADWIAHVTDYAERHYKEPLSLGVLAEISHGSPYHLHRTFKKIKGVTPLEYIRQLRIDKAKLLLLSTELPVADVGSKVGLAHTPYFITLFKRTTGSTPAGYRRSHGPNTEQTCQGGSTDEHSLP